MTLIVNPKNKSEEKVLKAFLNSLEIGYYTEQEEDKALHAAMVSGRKTKKLSKAEKAGFLKNLSSEKWSMKFGNSL